MEVVCACGNITKILPDPNTGLLPGLYEYVGKCPKCGEEMYRGHRIKEAEG